MKFANVALKYFFKKQHDNKIPNNFKKNFCAKKAHAQQCLIRPVICRTLAKLTRQKLKLLLYILRIRNMSVFNVKYNKQVLVAEMNIFRTNTHTRRSSK